MSERSTSDLKVSGHGRLGWFNPGFLGITLTASSELLTLSTPIVGSYEFRPDQIVEFKPHRPIFGLIRGLRIVHTNPDAPEHILFRGGHPEDLAQEILETGFLPSAASAATNIRRGIPFRWSFLFGWLILWNGLFFADADFYFGRPKSPGWLSVVPLGLTALLACALDRWPPSRVLALKPGRSYGEIRPIVRFVGMLTLTAFLFVLTLLIFVVPA